MLTYRNEYLKKVAKVKELQDKLAQVIAYLNEHGYSAVMLKEYVNPVNLWDAAEKELCTGKVQLIDTEYLFLNHIQSGRHTLPECVSIFWKGDISVIGSAFEKFGIVADFPSNKYWPIEIVI